MARSILITGCSSGIGRHAAHALRERGWRVFASARREADVAALKATGLEEALQLDLADDDSIRAAVARVREATGGAGPDALFNNGAFGQPGAVEDLDRERLRASFETNLFGTLELTNALLPDMRARGSGRVVMNGSVLGLIALPFRGAYTATKFALEGLTDTLRLELAGTGVHVSLIEPGPIRSRFRDNARANFHAHIDREHSPFRETYERVEKRLADDTDAPFTRDPDTVFVRLVHALEHPRPKPRYAVTGATHLLGTARRLLTTRALDRLLQRISRGENS
ncbi:MAG: SDR family NAD(P)-dependent oxidoreductase [Pseudomonadota bacterium]